MKHDHYFTVKVGWRWLWISRWDVVIVKKRLGGDVGKPVSTHLSHKRAVEVAKYMNELRE
jgi:hypothetical protein